jgi:DNA-directed RNA polymerase specialized sigma24 family protein
VASGTDPLSAACASRALQVVEATLEQMTAEQAQVFRWRMTSDLSFKEIAVKQQVSINTALGRHHSATKKIAAALRAAGLTLEST